MEDEEELLMLEEDDEEGSTKIVRTVGGGWHGNVKRIGERSSQALMPRAAAEGGVIVGWEVPVGTGLMSEGDGMLTTAHRQRGESSLERGGLQEFMRVAVRGQEDLRRDLMQQMTAQSEGLQQKLLDHMAQQTLTNTQMMGSIMHLAQAVADLVKRGDGKVAEVGKE